MPREANMFDAGNIVHTPATATSLSQPVQNLQLPPDLLWGAATAAYQIEGGAHEDGKGASIWDTFSHLEPSRTSGDNGDIACDHYHRVIEDVEMMKSLGIEIYRFSISWARLIPLGGRNDPVNEKGILFYNNLIDTLVSNGIEPFITLYHWDLPQALYDRYGAFLNTAEFTADFENYARLCFSRYGDRVKKWVTFNEPYVTSVYGYLNGTMAPGHSEATGADTKHEPWRVGHTLIVSHAAVAELYTKEFKPSQNGAISIVLNSGFYEPYDKTSETDKAAAQRRLEFYLAWFADPIYLGQDYPSSMRQYLGDRLPEFTLVERELLRRAALMNGFYGMNTYSSKYARPASGEPADDDWTGNIEETPINSEGVEIGPVSGLEWLRLAPEGFGKLLMWIWNRYGVPIIVTENGCPGIGEEVLEVALNDEFRQRYFGLYLDSMSRAIYEGGVSVQAYCAWSLMDNFEWSAGYGPRYGIVHVDYKTLTRTPKGSASYLKEAFKQRRGLNGGTNPTV